MFTVDAGQDFREQNTSLNIEAFVLLVNFFHQFLYFLVMIFYVVIDIPKEILALIHIQYTTIIKHIDSNTFHFLMLKKSI